MTKEWRETLVGIYEACKSIPNWLQNLRPFHDLEDIDYFEVLIDLDNKMQSRENGYKT